MEGPALRRRIHRLVNAYLAGGGRAVGVKAGRSYVDVGTLGGYRSAITLLAEGGEPGAAAFAVPAGPTRLARQLATEPEPR